MEGLSSLEVKCVWGVSRISSAMCEAAECQQLLQQCCAFVPCTQIPKIVLWQAEKKRVQYERFTKAPCKPATYFLAMRPLSWYFLGFRVPWGSRSDFSPG